MGVVGGLAVVGLGVLFWLPRPAPPVSPPAPQVSLAPPVSSPVQQGTAAQSLVTSRSPLVRAVKLVRDYGAVVTVLAVAIALVPAWTIWLMVAFTVINGLFLLASIAAAARASMPPAQG